VKDARRAPLDRTTVADLLGGRPLDLRGPAAA
jgi:hypothetical protein